MNIKIACVGRLKEKFYTDAAAEFEKRLSRYAKVQWAQVPDEPAPEQLSDALRSAVMEKEGKRLLEKLRPEDYVIALCVDGKRLTSPGLADCLDRLMTAGHSDVAFVIGGSLGLSPAVQERADLRLSFSDLTFSHQLIRVMLLEQVYRAFKIIRNEPYHK